MSDEMTAEELRHCHTIVWQWRAKLADVWPTPNRLDALRFAVTDRWCTRLVLVRDCISAPLQNVGDNFEVVAGPHGIYVLGPVDHPAYATATELYRTPTTTQETYP